MGRVTEPLRDRLTRGLGEGFRVEESLGEGGFAHVIAATDLRLKRRVAVKVLRPELAARPDLLERFRTEAEAMAAIRHPHVVPIHDVGESEGLAWFVMPLVEGPTLERKLDVTDPLDPEEARRILVEAALGLGAAHERGRIHRDVKPSNLLLEGDPERVVLADFGIARALEEEEGSASSIFTGSPEYASPEQLAGDPVDPRSDLYSLGVVGYRMLSGRLPFPDASPQALVVRQVMEDPERLDEIRPGLPADLVDAVHRCLEKEPNDRFTDAATLARRLEGEADSRGARGWSAVASPGAAPTPSEPPTRAGGRAVDSGSAPGPPAALFRRHALVVAAAGAGAALLDLFLLDQLLLTPVALLAGVVLLAHRYGTLWTRGHSLRSLVLGEGGGSIERSEGGSIREGGLLRASRAVRARILRVFERLSRVERERFGTVLPVVDEVLHRVRRDASRLLSLEARIESARRVERGQGRTAVLPELLDARRTVQENLEDSISLLDAIRAAFRRAVDGDDAARDDLHGLLAKAAPSPPLRSPSRSGEPRGPAPPAPRG